MEATEQWDIWLQESDSVHALAPEDYDDDAAWARVRALHERMVLGFPEYKVKTALPALYQDGTGLTHCRIASKSTDATLGWIVLSHFGELVTVADCSDADLRARIQSSLKDWGLKYIDHEYLASRTYNGKCPPLVGLSWENRYFALVVDFNAVTRSTASP